MKEVVEDALLHVDEHGPRLERPNGPSAIADGQHLGWLAPPVDILEECAERVVVAATRVVRGVLPEGELPEAAANLVPALPNLRGDKGAAVLRSPSLAEGAGVGARETCCAVRKKKD